MARARTIVIALIVSLGVAPQSGEAWGRQGHRIVARVAAKNLSSEARQKLRAILGTSDADLETAMAVASIWPDLIDRKTTGTANWHFVDVAVSSPFSLAGLCVAHDCVIDQIEQMRNRLQTNQRGFTLLQPPDPPRPTTSQLLAFLIHFVGDVHQPLHAAGNGDRGGNCVGLTDPLSHADGSTPTVDLHAAWDIDQVLAVMRSHGGSESLTATALFQTFRNGAPVTQGSAAEWARESNELARTSIYQKLGVPMRTAPHGRCAADLQKVSISQEYLTGNIASTEQRLMRAGIRLANLLNDICRRNGCAVTP